MSLYGSEKGVLDDFDAQLEYIDIYNFLFPQADWGRKSTINKPNLVSMLSNQRRISTGNEPIELYLMTNLK